MLEICLHAPQCHIFSLSCRQGLNKVHSLCLLLRSSKTARYPSHMIFRNRAAQYEELSLYPSHLLCHSYLDTILKNPLHTQKQKYGKYFYFYQVLFVIFSINKIFLHKNVDIDPNTQTQMHTHLLKCRQHVFIHTPVLTERQILTDMAIS